MNQSVRVRLAVAAGNALFFAGEALAGSSGAPATQTNLAVGAGVQGLIAVGLSWLAWHMRAKAEAARTRWAKVEGRMVQSEVFEAQFGKGRAKHAWLRRYRYRFEGAEYDGDELSIDQRKPRTEVEVRQMVETYPPNGYVHVYVNPARPSEAVLEPTAKITVLVGLAAILAATSALSVVGVVNWPR